MFVIVASPTRLSDQATAGTLPRHVATEAARQSFPRISDAAVKGPREAFVELGGILSADGEGFCSL
jgi:hypothetical protein